MRGIALSLSHLTVLDVAPPALFDLAAGAGYQSVGLRVLPAVPGGTCYPLDARSARLWRRQAADAGVSVNDIEFLPLTPHVVVQELAQTLEHAADLGAKRINVSGDDPDFERLVRNFGALCDLARATGLDVELEFMRFRCVQSLPQALSVVGRAARPNGKVLVDLLHLFRSGGTAELLGQAPSQAIGSVQLCDAPRAGPADTELADEARNGRLFPGEGELPIGACLEALPTAVGFAVEVPCDRTRPGLNPLQRAHRACRASRDLLAAYPRFA